MIKFWTFPQTENPPSFVQDTVAVFEQHSDEISTINRKKGLKSNDALAILREGLNRIGFDVERGKGAKEKIKRPVFFGENAFPSLQYAVDAWHPDWKAGLEVEAGRALGGNAVYRNLVQALVMVEMKYLFLAVPQAYRHKASGRNVASKDYEKTISIAQALYGHSRIEMPFSLCVIGY